jgi:tetratricopeptide (TPR) repeat protein
LEGQRISHYEVTERLGSGGMGMVYRAHDTRLGRDVALKFLAPGIGTDADARERFAAEARAASMLDHPGICTVYDVGETDEGALFIAMAYCEGQTLEQRLRGGPLPANDVFEIAKQVAEALAAAHSRGVIHRDVKPGNIMVDERSQVRVVDFGIAKLADSTLTRIGTVLGTIAYMAPEVIRGEAAGVATDVWSFGVMLYEMLTGGHPFEAAYEQAVAYRIIYEEPEPFTLALPPELEGLRDLIDECLEKDPARRPASMQEVATLLQGMQRTPGTGTQALWWPPRAIRRVMRGRHPRATGLAIVSGMAALALVAVLLGHTPPIPSEKHVVVLPLMMTGASPDDQLLSAGLTVIVTNKLAQLASFTDESYWVVPHTEVRDRTVSSASAARRAFGATLAVEGHVVRLASGLQVALSLIDTRTMRTLRAVDFIVPHDQIDGLHEEVARRTAQMMRVPLRPGFERALEAGRTSDPEAYALFVRARGHLERHERKENIEAAVDLLRSAVELDPGFGAAYAALGEASWYLYHVTRDELYISLALRYLDQALVIDRRLSEAHVAMARLYLGTDQIRSALEAIEAAVLYEPANADALLVLARIHDTAGDPDQAERTFREAITMRPSYWSGYSDLGAFYYRRGRYEDAVAQFRRVVLLTPDNGRGYNILGASYFHLQQFEDAAAAFERAVDIHPTYGAYSNLGTLYFYMNDMERAAAAYLRALELEDGHYDLWLRLGAAYEQAGRGAEHRDAVQRAARLVERRLQIHPGDHRARVDLAGILIVLEDRARAAQILASMDDRSIGEVEVMFLIGAAHEGLGGRAVALDWLCRAVAGGYSLVQIDNAPSLASLREDPRFAMVATCADS